MKKITFLAVIVCSFFTGNVLQAQYVGTPPAHVIIVMEENYSYQHIIGSSLAPTFTALSKDTFCANMTLVTAITHPSEPNYLELFSGSNHGVTTDLTGPCPGAPLNDCNIGSSVIQAGYTFIGYSEDQPSVGWINSDAGNYYTKHCPWINWVGAGVPAPYDSIPIASDLPMVGYFPDSNHYSSLPNMAWVIPNSIDDMHDGSSSSAIPNGDNWFKINMMPLVRWVANPVNHSVLIVLWDEDDYNTSSLPYNHIPLLVCGGMVKGGNYNTALNHYSTLRLMEEMFGITNYCGSSASASEYPSAMWNPVAGINSVSSPADKFTTWPVPAKNECNIHIVASSADKANISLYDVEGRLIQQIQTGLKPGDNYVTLNTSGVSNGVYSVSIIGEKINICKKIVVGK
jgi:hypothetical protein